MPGPEIQFLTINHDKYIPFSDSSSKGSLRNSSRVSLGSFSQPRLKTAHTFDLGSLLEQLPPNTGPPGSVPVNGGSGAGANANKNLSHVPCKFFRQGNCQAGNSCPFSHNLDGSLAADKLPCKYFQKGNCKFGLKCALAHFLPDGTRVNSKSLNLNFRRQERGQGGSHESGILSQSIELTSAPTLSRSRGSFNSSTGAGAHRSKTHVGGSSDASYRPSLSSSAEKFHSGSRFSASDLSAHGSAEIYALGDAKTNISEPINIRTSSFGDNDASHSISTLRASLHNSSSLTLYHMQNGGRATLSSVPGNYQATQDWLLHSGVSSNTFTTPNSLTAAMRSLSSTSPTTMVSLPASIDFSSNLLHNGRTELPSDHFAFRSRLGLGTSNFFMSPPHTNVRIVSESAILDGSQEEDALEDDENAFFEDYVPASLGNLILTPQERQRRDSRSQSGTLWVRPTIERSQSVSKKNPTAGHDNDVFLME